MVQRRSCSPSLDWTPVGTRNPNSGYVRDHTRTQTSCTQTHTHANTHTRKHTHTHARTHARKHAHSIACNCKNNFHNFAPESRDLLKPFALDKSLRRRSTCTHNMCHNQSHAKFMGQIKNFNTRAVLLFHNQQTRLLTAAFRSAEKRGTKHLGRSKGNVISKTSKTQKATEKTSKESKLRCGRKNVTTHEVRRTRF